MHTTLYNYCVIAVVIMTLSIASSFMLCDTMLFYAMLCYVMLYGYL